MVGVPYGEHVRRSIDFTLTIGVEATDTQEMARKEHLKPLEVELRVLESVMDSIVDEMEYLKGREAKMRDTNGNTPLYSIKKLKICKM
jgi:hypothetical protein